MPQTESLAVPDDIDRIIVVSDLHGLTAPLEVIDDIVNGFREEVQVIAAGDYSVNGLRPKETLEWVRRAVGEFAILGNHDVLDAPKGDFPVYTEEGAFNRFDAGLKHYLSGLPRIIELTWRGKRMRIAHDCTPSGEYLSWTATVPEAVKMFADPTVDLNVCAHTHYPFVEQLSDTIVANSGSTSCLLLGHKKTDGSIHYKGRKGETFEPVCEIYSTYISIVIKEGRVHPTVERFTYDCEPEIEELQDIGHPGLARLSVLYRTGLDIEPT